MDTKTCLKDILLGMTLGEMEYRFQENFNPLTKELVYNGVTYQLLTDANADSEFIIVDLFAKL